MWVAELRASSYKNNRLCYIPENLIVRNVGSVLNDDDSLNDPEAPPLFCRSIGILFEVTSGLCRCHAVIEG